MLGDEAPVDGAAELRRVGRCLDWQYPDELDRVVLRDAELAELTRLLDADERRPVLLLGPRQVGKTALLHEYTFRRVAQRKTKYRDHRNVWLLAPARLISGMSYVGQWENRLLAILKEARRRDHVLYFDDLLGLFQAGQSACSSLNVAGVLKPYLERRRVRVVGEITPEALRVLREKDRGFADLFHILPVPEPNEYDTLRILIAVQRQLENQNRSTFDLDVLPVVLDLQRRYGRGLAFPGKAATFLRQLAVKQRGQSVARQTALHEFHVRSGLSTTFLDRQTRLDRDDVVKGIAAQVIGQEAAVAAAADVITVAKARLNDPDRPLASFLFLGPTGVGKTQCAKAIAAYLFGDADRLLRFDLNEFSDPDSAARLVGTFSQPEGLLTSAIRRQPFAVVLFDEVEKAHPEVFDLLLQVLGEGRLTDALGRTVDFGNALIVLTSNLGVRESESHAGFRADEAARDALFVRAAERFFRPEFFNRLDRVIPFHRLTRPQVRAIADQLIRDVLRREGLVQRKCFLHVEPDALERVVDQGFDPVLGARALKRAIEKQLTQPVAAQLAALRANVFTALRVYRGPDDLLVHVQTLEQVAPAPRPPLDLRDTAAVLKKVRAAVRRIDDDLSPLRPEGAFDPRAMRPEQYRYFAVRQQMDRVRELEGRLSERVEQRRLRRSPLPTYRKPDAPRGHLYKIAAHDVRFQGEVLREMAAAMNINEYLRDLIASATVAADGPDAPELLDLLGEVALLDLMARSSRSVEPEQVLLLVRGLAEAEQPEPLTARKLFGPALEDLLARAFRALQLDASPWPDKDLGPNLRQASCIVLHGLHALALARPEAGLHLFEWDHAALEPFQVDVLSLPSEGDPAVAADAWLANRRRWLDDLRAGRAAVGDDPFAVGPVVRIYDDRNAVDLRSGTTAPHEQLAALIRAGLPLPAELTESGDDE